MYNTNMLKNKFYSLILFLIVTFSASFTGGLVSISFKEPWYSSLVKSNYNPPDWIFAPVWTTLYIMMTLAIWFFWHLEYCFFWTTSNFFCISCSCDFDNFDNNFDY